MPISVAFDAAGVAAAGPWIQAAKPTHPSLIDTGHLVADLYGMINVPNAVWINEDGRIVRPNEAAGASDGFRAMDHTTFKMPEEAIAETRDVRRAYTDGLRDWVERGEHSPWALSEDEVLRRLQPATNEHELAAANFTMGRYLHGLGEGSRASRYFAEAVRLHPENWSYKRQSWALDDPAKAGGREFWAAVDALGSERYYPAIDMPGNST